MSVTTPKTKDVVLLCNPRAGGRWRALAEVLDSPEARVARRIVTDEIDDVRQAISSLGQRVKLLCVYGGDGTIQRVIDDLLRVQGDGELPHQLPSLAILGGGTMNVTARWCGMRDEPGDNFRAVIRAYLADRLLFREVPLLAVTQGGETHYGFTFGAGPLIRILERYENGTKGHLAAVGLGLRSIVAALTRLPGAYRDMLEELSGTIMVDDQRLPYERYAAVFANVTGAINPFVEPFVGERTRDSFHFLAYAVSSREFAGLAPLLARAKLPIDPRALLRPSQNLRQLLRSLRGKGELPLDPRYVNHPARRLRLETNERHCTIDGELVPLRDGRVDVTLGPTIRLALCSEADFTG